MSQTIYQKLLYPKAANEDDQRREFILNILLLGIIVLSGAAVMSAIISRAVRIADYSGVSLLTMLGMGGVFVVLYLISRAGFYRPAAYAFVTIFVLISTYPLVIWGVLLPQGILLYSLVIVMTGVLLSSRTAFRLTVTLTVILLTIVHLGATNVIRFDTEWLKEGGGYNDVIVYGVTFLIIAVVSWLSNREIERSLARARRSEDELRQERNLLEVKVKQRTQQLERAQVQKMSEINRFAEFGRVGSTLLHELSNPLTSLSLNLEQIESKQKSTLIKQVRESVTFMEEYVASARRQLRNQSEIKSFEIAHEIKQVAKFLEPKATKQRVKIQLNLAPNLRLLGDAIRFDQCIANLIANAIDAYTDAKRTTDCIVEVSAVRSNNAVIIQVRDHGMGISKAKLQHVFDAFYTTKTAARGTGLGLTITKRTIEEDFKGTVEVASSKREGTCFTIEMALL